MTILYYHIQKSCRLKRRHSLMDLAPMLELLRCRAEEEAEAGQALGADSTWLVEALRGSRVRYLVESGGPTHSLSPEPEELARGIDLIRRLRRRCNECEANCRPRELPGGMGLGCIGWLDLPVVEEAENGLLSLVEELMEHSAELDPTTTLPVRFIWDNGLQGGEIAELREHREVFEASEALEARIGPFLQKHPLNTNQFLSLFFLPGKLHRPYLHLFGPFFSELVRIGTERSEEAGPRLAPWLCFFDSLVLASELDVEMEVIYLRQATTQKEVEPRLATPLPRSAATD